MTGIGTGLSPAMLVYERTLLAESAVVLLTVLCVFLFVSALQAQRYGRAVAAGLAVGTIVTMRTNNAAIWVGLVLLAFALGAPSCGCARKWASSAR